MEDAKKILDADRRNQASEDYFNAQFEAEPRLLLPGEMIFSGKSEDMIVSNVGAGIFVCAYYKDLSVGAASYAMISQSLLGVFPFFTRSNAKEIDRCLENVEACFERLNLRNTDKKRIYVRLIGGANLPGDTSETGTKNYVFVREYINRSGLNVLNEDIGGNYVRRVYFFPSTGRLVRRVLRRSDDFALVYREQDAYQKEKFS